MGMGACSDPGYQYVKNSQVNTYFKVPTGWKLFDEDRIFASQGNALSPQGAVRSRATQWVVAFDADPKPSIDHVLDEGAVHPMGFARVRALGAEEREVFSLAHLRNDVLPLDRLSQQSEDQLELLRRDDIARKDGMRGTRQVHNIRVDSGWLTLDQTALLTADTSRLHLLIVGCQATCYEQNKKRIEEVVQSWTVDPK